MNDVFFHFSQSKPVKTVFRRIIFQDDKNLFFPALFIWTFFKIKIFEKLWFFACMYFLYCNTLEKKTTTTVGTITINVRAANPEKAAHARHVTSGPVGTERERERERERDNPFCTCMVPGSFRAAHLIQVLQKVSSLCGPYVTPWPTSYFLSFHKFTPDTPLINSQLASYPA